MEGDKLFKYDQWPKCCNGCKYAEDLYILAETQEEADAKYAEGAGLCGFCMCDNIIDTCGMVVTDPKKVRG